MKNYLTSLAVLLLTPFITATADDEGQWYGEGGYHIVTVDDSDADVTVGMLGVNLGYEFASGFALEAIIAQGVVDDSVTVGGLGTFDVGLGTSYGIAAKYSFEVSDKVNLYGKLRYSSFEVEVEAAGLTVSESEEEVGFGVGGNYLINENMRMILEYNRFAEDSNAYFFGLGILF